VVDVVPVPDVVVVLAGSVFLADAVVLAGSVFLADAVVLLDDAVVLADAVVVDLPVALALAVPDFGDVLVVLGPLAAPPAIVDVDFGPFGAPC
jgi:hypothetical protein